MNDTPLLLRELSRRLIPSVFCFGAGAVVLYVASRTSGGQFLTACVALFGLGFLITGALFLAPTLANIMAQPSGNIFYPLERFSKPQPVYSIPRSNRLQSKFDEALKEYRIIIEEHPQELKAYIEMIDLAHLDLKDDLLARRVFDEGIASLNEPEDRETLAHKFHDAVPKTSQY